MRDTRGELEGEGARIVVVGSGTPDQARAFAEDEGWKGTLLLDPDLVAYRAAGMRRGRVEVLSPRLGWNAARAFAAGHRQGAVEGDPWQLGGVLAIRPGGRLVHRHVSREAGDHADLDEVVEALVRNEEVTEAPAPTAPPWAAEVVRRLRHVLDPTLIGSFDRPGFVLHSLSFDPTDLDVDLAGRVCVVTGANSGIGFETARGLADLGAEVVLVCRNEERGRAACERIRSETGNRRARLEVADVSALADVEALAERLGEGRVDVLVHNAGVLPGERCETGDGLESVFATHVAGPHLLTKRLVPALTRAEGRVIWVSSGGMYTRGLQLTDWNWTQRAYDGVTAYAETKRAQVVLAELWAERLRAAGVTVHAMHPGWADTPAVQSSLPAFHRITKSILRSPVEGADTVVWLAASEAAKAETGCFYFDRQPQRTVWLPGTGAQRGDRDRLWRLAEGAFERAEAGSGR